MRTLLVFTFVLLSASSLELPSFDLDNAASTLWPLVTPVLGGVSPACLQQSLQYIDALQRVSNGSIGENEAWALQMLDSSGTLPVEGFLSDTMDLPIGIFLGIFGLDSQTLPPSLQSMTIPVPLGYSISSGSYEGCLGVRNGEIKGQYCTIQMSAGIGREQETTFQPVRQLQNPMVQINKEEFFESLMNLKPSLKMNATINEHPFLHKLLDKQTTHGRYIEKMKEELSTLINKYYPKFKAENPDYTNALPLLIAAVWIQMQAVFSNFLMGTPLTVPRPSSGHCFPSACTPDDIDLNYYAFFQQFSTGSLSLSAYIGRYYGFIRFPCMTEDFEAEWTYETYCVVVVFSILAFFLTVGTFVDVWDKFSPYQADLHFSESKEDSFLIKALKTFSLPANLSSLMSTVKPGGDHLGCLDGIRFISMSWVILGHSFLYFGTQLRIQNILYLLKLSTDYSGMAFAAVTNATNGGPVDTFFLLSGTLVTYLLLKELDKSKGINIVGIIMFYVHRYLRLTIPYAFVIATVILLPLIASGPIWPLIAFFSCDNCKQYWWQNLLYINNFGDHALSCLGVTWYLCCDMIFYWFSLPIIYPMWRFWRNKPMQAVSWIGLILGGFTIERIYHTWELVTGRYIEHKMPVQYMAPWERCQPYLLGILLGYALHKTKGKPIYINGTVNILLWQASFLLAFAIVYGTWDWNHWPIDFTGENGPSTAERVAYGGLMRLVWPLSLAWPIFACCRGYGGIVNEFLSWNAFVPLSRLTYLCYLLHMGFAIDGIAYNINFGFDISLWMMVGLFLSAFVVAMALAFGLTLAFEIPFIKLEKLVFGILLGTGGKKKKMEPKLS